MSVDGWQLLQGLDYSPVSMSGGGPASADVEDIHDLVHALNESVQRQLEEVERRYMELKEQHPKEKEQWNQLLQSMEQRRTMMYSYFEQIWSDGLSSGI